MACKQPASIFSLPNDVNSDDVKVDERVVEQNEVMVFATCEMQPLN